MMNNEFLKTYGFAVYQQIFIAVNRLDSSNSNFGSILIDGATIDLSMKFLKRTAVGSYFDKTKNISFDFELTFGRNEAITYFHKNTISSNKLEVKTPSSSKKECTCNWSFLHSNNGCKCGAITPYKPKY